MTQFPLAAACLDHLLGDPQDAVGIQQLQAVHIQAAFEAASQDRFEEPIVKRVDALFAALDLRLVAVGKLGNLAGQQLIPQLPAQAIGYLRAIAAPPQPYSRSMVMILITVLSPVVRSALLLAIRLADRRFAAAACGSFFFKRKDRTNMMAAPTASTMKVSM